MKSRGGRALKLTALVIGILLLVGIAAAAMPQLGPIKDWLQHAQDKESAANEPAGAVQIVPGQPDTVQIADGSTIQQLGVTTAEIKRLTRSRKLEPAHDSKSADGWNDAQVREATHDRVLQLLGTTAFDQDHLQPIRSRFPGEVVEISNLEGVSGGDASLQTVARSVRFGDRVSKGQLLAVVWSTDLGQKKSDLVDALSQFRLDEKLLKTQHALLQKGDIPETVVRQMEQRVESDKNRVATAQRILRTWRVSDEEIRAVEQEAERILAGGTRDAEKEKNWARVEVKAPFDGVIVEKNVTMHQIVDTSTDLFKIADMRHVEVWAHVFEEDLPALHSLKPGERRWHVRLQADPNFKPLPGTIDVIGPIVDPNQHTALVKGLVNNPDELLRVGQPVLATVALPAHTDDLIVPTTALVEDGKESIVFVKLDSAKPVYAQRSVKVLRRGQEVVFLRAASTAKMAGETGDAAALAPGDRVVTDGAIELKAALEDLQAAAQKQEGSP
jgi:membrane fusion protein, heavy metal efflux system